MQRTFGFIYRTVLYSFAIVLVLFALFISALRYLLPQLPDVTDQLESILQERFRVEASLGSISADWGRNGPELVLHQLRVQPMADKATRVDIEQARILLNFWQSAGSLSLQYDQVQLDQLVLHYDMRDAELDDASSGIVLSDNLTNLLLNQLDHIEVTDSTIELVNLLGIQRAIDIQDLRWMNREQRHQGVGKLTFSEVTDNTLDFIVDIRGNSVNALTGQVYVNAHQLDISPWVQQQVVDTQINQAEFNLQLWLNFAQNQFTEGLLQLGEQALTWQVGQEQHALRIPHGELKLRPFGNSGWRVNSNPLTIEHNNDSWVLPTFSWEQTPRSTAMSFVDVPLAPMLELLNLLGSEGAAVSEQLADRSAQGTMDIALQQSLEQPLRWFAQGEQLSWGQIAGVPGLTNVNLSLQGQENRITWRLDGKNAAFQSDALDYDDAWALPYINVSGDFVWHNEQDWQLYIAPGSRIELEGLPIAFQARLQPVDGSVMVNARANSVNEQPIPAAVLRQHLPVVMGDNLHDYLTVAIQDGEAQELAMSWRGTVADFPYHNKRGEFEARARLTGMNYKFQPDWRPVYDANVVVNFNNERMHIVATDGQLGNIDAQRVDVVIPDILAGPDAYLDIKAAIAGNATELQPIFNDSPLAGSLGTTFTELKLSGPLTSQLQLTIPLTETPDVVAEGYADLSDVTMKVESLGETFTDIRGRVRFRNDKVESDDLAIRWNGFPIEAKLNTQQREDDFYVDVSAVGHWNLERYKPLVSGAMPWQADFNLSLPTAGGYAFRWQQTADISQANVQAPAPFYRESGTEGRLELMVSGDQESILVNAEVDDFGLLELQLDSEEQSLPSGYMRIGNEFGQAPSPNVVRLNPRFMVDVNIQQMDLEAWQQAYQSLQQLIPEKAVASAWATRLQPDFIQLTTNNMTYDAVQLDDVTTVAWPSAEGWQARIESKQVLTDVIWQANEEGKDAIKIRADYIELSSGVDEPEATPRQAPKSFTGLPDIYLDCQRCQFDSYDLGEVSLHLSATDKVFTLERFSAKHRNHDIVAHGSWALETDTKHPQTHLTGTFKSADFGEFLETYNVTSMVRDSSATFDFDLRFLAAPYSFESKSLNGTVKWNLGQGYLNEVSDRGARLFSLLSLDGILRKLRFDFRDVFANGLFYTNFSGDFNIANGIVNTTNTQLNGAAGDMEVKGSTNLVTRQLDYDLQFVPKVTSSLPVILAWMINPPSGLAALVIDRMLYDAKVISRLEYEISGTMDDPTITEVARDSRAAPIPPEVRDNVDPNQSSDEQPQSGTDGAADDQQREPTRQPENN